MQPEPIPFLPEQTQRVEEIRRNIVNAANCNVGPTRPYLIKGWLGSAGLSMVYGESNVGKSFLALDAALHVAAGEPWHGSRVQRARVLYIASEGGQSIMARLEAVRREYPDLYAQAVPDLDVLPIQVDLHGANDTDAIIKAASGPYSLIIVDTLAQSFGAGNENESRDMNAFISNIMKLRAHFDCQVLLVHHSGKDAARGARGHSSLRAAVDTEIELKRQGSIRVATVTKQRDMQTGDRMAYTLKQVALGIDEDGDPVTNCVVVPSSVPAEVKKPPKGFAEVALQALYEVLRSQGRRILDSANYPGNRQIVEIAQWRDHLCASEVEGDKTDQAFKKAFQRARSALKQGDYIRECNGKVWLVGDIDLREDTGDN